MEINVKIKVPADFDGHVPYVKGQRLIDAIEAGEYKQVSGEPCAWCHPEHLSTQGLLSFTVKTNQQKDYVPLYLVPQISAEPIAWMFTHNRGNGKVGYTFETTEEHMRLAYRDTCLSITPLFAAPQQREPLSDLEITSLAYDLNALPEVITDETLLALARAIQAAHNIGEKK
jgi:hypothetical protein